MANANPFGESDSSETTTLTPIAMGMHFTPPDTWEREHEQWGFPTFDPEARFWGEQSLEFEPPDPPDPKDDEIVCLVQVESSWFKAPRAEALVLGARRLSSEGASTFSKGDLERAMSELRAVDSKEEYAAVTAPQPFTEGPITGWRVHVQGHDSQHGHDVQYGLLDSQPFTWREYSARYYDREHGRVVRIIRISVSHCDWEDGILPDLPFREGISANEAERENRRERMERLKDACVRTEWRKVR